MTTMIPSLRFDGRILLLGCGSVSQCLQPLLLRHLDMPFDKLTVMDFEDLRDRIPQTLAAGANYVQHRITPDNLAATLREQLGPGDVLINLSWNIGAEDIISWCHDHGVRYVDTSVEQWDPSADMDSRHPTERTLYARHMSLRKLAAGWSGRGAQPTGEGWVGWVHWVAWLLAWPPGSCPRGCRRYPRSRQRRSKTHASRA